MQQPDVYLFGKPKCSYRVAIFDLSSAFSKRSAKKPEIVHHYCPLDEFFLRNKLYDENSQKFHPKFEQISVPQPQSTDLQK